MGKKKRKIRFFDITDRERKKTKKSRPGKIKLLSTIFDEWKTITTTKRNVSDFKIWEIFFIFCRLSKEKKHSLIIMWMNGMCVCIEWFDTLIFFNFLLNKKIFQKKLKILFYFSHHYVYIKTKQNIYIWAPFLRKFFSVKK